MATSKGRIVLVVLAVVAAASLWRTASTERQRKRLSSAYGEAQQLLEQVSQERDQLNGELAQARQTVEGQAGDMANLKEELGAVQGKLRETLAQIVSLQRKQASLHQENASLSTRLGAAVEERAQLEARLSNIKELKLAIRDVRRKVWQQRFAAWRARLEQLRREDTDRLASGNRGYLVKDGKSTMGPATRLQVHVLEPQSQ